MQYATDQVQVEIDQMYLEHQSQVLREGRIIDQFFEQHMGVKPTYIISMEDLIVRLVFNRKKKEIVMSFSIV